MIRGLAPALLAVAPLATAACTVTNPDYCCTTQASCAEAGTPPTPCDDGLWCDDGGEFGPIRACVPLPDDRCFLADDCTDPGQPLCVDQRCVECAGDEDCPAEAPSCEAGRCTSCAADDECASGVCDLQVGGCVAPDRVLYVAPDGLGDACTVAAPCATPQQALALVTPARDVIRLAPGTYVGELAVAGATVLVSGPGATLRPDMDVADSDVVEVGDGADVTLDRVTLLGATGTGAGVRCVGDATTPAARLRDVTLTANTGNVASVRCEVTLERVTATGGTLLSVFAMDTSLRVFDSALLDNDGTGISLVGGDLVVEGSTIARNAGGGLSVTEASFAIVNSWIVDNGGPTGSTGGVRLSMIPVEGARTLEFTTIAGNDTDNLVAAGIGCDATVAGPPVVFRNNVVWGNQSNVAVTGACGFAYSLVEDGVPGEFILTADPQFVDSAGGDYHLQAGSPAVDAADPAATLAIDIDGDARPQGERRDLGADEVVP